MPVIEVNNLSKVYQVYRKREPIVGIPNAILRAITTKIPLKFLWKICRTMAPLHAFLVRMVAKMRGEKSLRAQIDDGTATAEGDVSILAKLAEAMVTFELGFEILPGTKGGTDDESLNPYEVGPLRHQPE